VRQGNVSRQKQKTYEKNSIRMGRTRVSCKGGPGEGKNQGGKGKRVVLRCKQSTWKDRTEKADHSLQVRRGQNRPTTKIKTPAVVKVIFAESVVESRCERDHGVTERTECTGRLKRKRGGSLTEEA